MKNMNYALLFLGLFFGIMTARAVTIGVRGGIEINNPAVIVIYFGSMVAIFAIIVWAFLNITWWIALMAPIAVSGFVAIIISRERWVIFYQAAPATGLITIFIAIATWAI